MNRMDLQKLAEERLADSELLLANRRYGAAYYLAGYAVECGLKACIAKLTKAEDFYDKLLARKIFTHNLEELLVHASLADIFAKNGKSDYIFAANWAQVSSWSEESRYKARTQQETEVLVAGMKDPVHGVMPCIRQYW
jgi:HEPN domain-containing protein